MAVITLKELVSLNRQRSSPLGNFQASERSIQQQQFQQLVRQKRMGLNIQPSLNPQLTIWLEQLEGFIPGLSDPRKKIYLNTRWQAQLLFESEDYWLSVPVNAGVVRNKVRLYEWRIGSVELNWSDRVKLWVACNYLQYQPKDLVTIICAFSPEHNGHVKKTRWNDRDYCAIERELKLLLKNDTSKTSFNQDDNSLDYIFNIDEIEEVKL